MATSEPDAPPGRLRTALGRLFRRRQDVQQPTASNTTQSAPVQPATQQHSSMTPSAPQPHAMPMPIWLHYQLNQPPIMLTPLQQQQQQQLLMQHQQLMQQQQELMEEDQQQAAQHPWMQLPATQQAGSAMMQNSWDWQFWAQQHHEHQNAAHQQADAAQQQDMQKRQLQQQQQQEHDAMAKVTMWQDALHNHQFMLAQQQQQLRADGQWHGSHESTLQQLLWQQQQVQQQHVPHQHEQQQGRMQPMPPGTAHKHTPDSYQRLLMYQSQIFGLPIPPHLLPLQDPNAPPPTPLTPDPWLAPEPAEPADSALDLIYQPKVTSYLDRWHVDRYGDFAEPPRPMQHPPRDAIQHAAMLQAAMQAMQAMQPMQAAAWHNPVYEPELWFSPPLPPAPSPPPSAPRTPRPSLPGKVTASVQNMLGYLTHLGKKHSDRAKPGAEAAAAAGSQAATLPAGPLHPTLAALR